MDIPIRRNWKHYHSWYRIRFPSAYDPISSKYRERITECCSQCVGPVVIILSMYEFPQRRLTPRLRYVHVVAEQEEDAILIALAKHEHPRFKQPDY